MLDLSPAQVTQLLQDHSSGDSEAFDKLFPLVYDELRRIASRHLNRERRFHTLNTTALVHECYLNLANREATWENRAHFSAIASKAMRHLLIDYARRRNAQKRGGDKQIIPLDGQEIAVHSNAEELIELDEALSKLAERDERLSRVVECRFFGGMTMEETASAMKVSVRTVQRDWNRARAYLHKALSPEP